MTIGDVLAVIGGVAGVGLTIWAMLVLSALAFEGLTRTGQRLLEKRRAPILFTGVVVAATVGVIALALLNQANGLFKLIGTGLFLSILAVGAVGGGAIAASLGARIRRQDPEVTPFHALLRGAGLMVLAGFAPLVGWFLFAPVMLLLGTGIGFRALLAARRGDLPEVPPALGALEPSSAPVKEGLHSSSMEVSSAAPLLTHASAEREPLS